MLVAWVTQVDMGYLLASPEGGPFGYPLLPASDMSSEAMLHLIVLFWCWPRRHEAAHLAGEWSLVITFVLMASKVLDVGHHLSGVVDVNSWVDLRLVLGMGMFKPLSRQVSQSLPTHSAAGTTCSCL